MNDRLKNIIKRCFNAAFVWLGVLFALFCSAGKSFYKTGGSGLGSAGFYLRAAALACVFIPVLSALFRLIERPSAAQKPLPRFFNSKWFFIAVWAFIFAMWVPVWLGAYPGFFSYDANRILTMYVTGTMTTINPVLNTVIMSSAIVLGYRLTSSDNAAIALYCVVRMALLSGVFAYTVVWLKRRGAALAGIVASALFYALFPLIAVFACCTAKDVEFSAAVLLFLIMCIDFSSGKQKNTLPRVAALVAVGLFMLLMRHNAILAFVPFAVIFTLECKREKRKAAIALAAILALFFSFNLYVKYGMKIPSGNPGESLSVPIQQLARAACYNEDKLSAGQLAAIDEYLGEGVYKSYDPKRSDPVKDSFNAELFKAAPLDFFALWADVGKDNAGAYLDAFVANTVDLVYPLGYIDGYLGEPSYFRVMVEHPGHLDSKLPGVYNAYYSLFNDPNIISNKLLSTLFSPALAVWLTLFALGCAYARKSSKKAPLWFLTLLAATILFGPIVINRYVLYLYFCAPLTLFIALGRAGASERGAGKE